MAKISNDRLTAANAAVDDAKPKYDRAVKVATEADEMMTRPELRQLVVNTALAKSMISSNRLYPDLFDSVKPYIPRFFRITNLSATPNDAASSTVNMTGTVKNAQEYADLMLALLRIPGAVSVTRAGFQAEDMVVPSLTLVDQNGRPRLESKAPIPDDPLDRLRYFQDDTPAPTGFLNAGNYGDLNEGVIKGARPGESIITVSVIVPKNLQVPNPRATIQALAGGTPTPNANNARPAGNNTPPTAPPSTGGAPQRAGRGGDDE